MKEEDGEKGYGRGHLTEVVAVVEFDPGEEGLWVGVGPFAGHGYVNPETSRRWAGRDRPARERKDVLVSRSHSATIHHSEGTRSGRTGHRRQIRVLFSFRTTLRVGLRPEEPGCSKEGLGQRARHRRGGDEGPVGQGGRVGRTGSRRRGR